MGESAELEIAEFFAFPNVMPADQVGADEAGGHVGHSDGDEADEADGGVVGLDENDGAGRDVRQGALGVDRVGRGGGFG